MIVPWYPLKYHLTPLGLVHTDTSTGMGKNSFFKFNLSAMFLERCFMREKQCNSETHSSSTCYRENQREKHILYEWLLTVPWYNQSVLCMTREEALCECVSAHSRRVGRRCCSRSWRTPFTAVRSAGTRSVRMTPPLCSRSSSVNSPRRC